MINKQTKSSRTAASDICEVHCINPAAVKQARKKALALLAATDLAQIFQVMADSSRLRLISLLAERELCVCDLAAALGMSRSAVSHQLRVLRMAKLVKYRKEGRIAYYSLDDEHVLKLFTTGLEHLGHRSTVKRGLK
ncbi:MAG: ArsR/SmtB family transcription factor [Thermoleophilia bacterium]|jgi:ArsR family transcriptional regulator